MSHALARAGLSEILVHTGQHYDSAMSDEIMADIGLRTPDTNLGVGSGLHGAQTARMLEGLENTMLETQPDAVLIYGDTNSTVAASLAAAKLGIFTAHVEAGLRSFNRAMPEELNRIATDHLSDLLAAPTETAMGHLEREGLSKRSVLTGDVMVDALMSIALETVPLPDWVDGQYLCSTIHRAENTDDPRVLRNILEALDTLPRPVHLLAHPRLRARLEDLKVEFHGSLQIRQPVPYATMLATVKNSQGLLTDSGGLQKEAFILEVPCITLRTETEWPETEINGWNVIAPPIEALNLAELVERTPEPVKDSPFGSGDAADRIVESVLAHL